MKVPGIEGYLGNDHQKQEQNQHPNITLPKSGSHCRVIERQVRRVLEAPDGNKHTVLNTAAYLLGGYVAGGLVNEQEAEQALTVAIDSRDCDSYEDAYKTIRRGVKDGQKRPIRAENIDQERQEYLKANHSFPKTDNTPAESKTTSALPEFDPAAILAEAEIDVAEELPPPPVCLSIDQNGYQITIGTLGNFSMVIGKAKSRKTFCVVFQMAALVRNDLVLGKVEGHLPQDKTTVLHIDTEQGKFHTQRTAKRVLRLAGCDTADNYKAFALRKYAPDVRLEVIEYAIYHTPNLGVVVIDGIRDLASLGINDEEQATQLTTKLLKWTEEKQIHIVVVLHQNKNDTNARGHLGTELVNKAETVISVTKDEKNTSLSIVQAEYCRDKDFEPFGFIIDDNGLPQIAEHWEMTAEKYDTQKGITPLEVPIETHKAVLKKAFEQTPDLQYSKLVLQLKLAFEWYGKKMGDNKVKSFIEYYLNEKLIQQEGKPHSKYCKYTSLVEVV